MSLGVRGSNPIWSEVDLQGKQFDDTFYLFVLENTIPYVPATVFHDADMNVPWTQPIQFLGNGTLPIDVYYQSSSVYRLEFRQGNTQAAPLIYEVDNYVPNGSGSSPIDSVAFATSNEITNPQFALFDLKSPTVISGTDPAPIVIAPGWELLVSGTGTATINQVALTDSNINPSNAPYALRLTLTGWTADTAMLRQRFRQNGMLWANKIVSSAVTTLLNGAPQFITATLVDSNNSVLGTVLPSSAVNETWIEYTGYAQLTDTTNPDTPPAAYVDYLLNLPSNIDIYLTSFQLVAQDLPIQPSFEQDSIDRQIDHTYNRAYPIVPVGAVIDFAGFVVPEHYYACDGAAKNRVRDYRLFSALTTVETVTLTNTVATFTVVSNANYHIGMLLEGVGIPATTTISNIVGTTITMSLAATASGATPVTFFAWGNGDGSTTFNVPNLQGFVTAGAKGQLFYTSSPGDLVNGPGLSGGEARHALTSGENGPHTHPPAAPSTGFIAAVGAAGALGGGAEVGSYGVTGSSGSGTPHNNIQPTILILKCIRYQ